MNKKYHHPVTAILFNSEILICASVQKVYDFFNQIIDYQYESTKIYFQKSVQFAGKTKKATHQAASSL